MSDLTRVFCVCGNEIQDTDSHCSVCQGHTGVVFDAVRHNARKRNPESHKRTKAHDNTCECDKCEEMQADRQELDFS